MTRLWLQHVKRLSAYSHVVQLVRTSHFECENIGSNPIVATTQGEKSHGQFEIRLRPLHGG